MRRYDGTRYPTITAFHRDSSFVRGLMGPVGSGKSTSCAMELLNRAMLQKPNRKGVRRSRWVVIRNTYPELRDTTIKTCQDWWPIEGTWKLHQDMTYTWQTDTVHFEVLFRSLDKLDDVRKLLSLELTGAWVNEAREIGRSVIDMLLARVGRFPSARDGGPTWSGIIMDTNPPDTDSWWYRLFEEQHPDGWMLFRQPSAEDEHAENLENLPRHYYDRLKAANDEEWCNVYVRGRYGTSADGKPVHPYFRRDVHVAQGLQWHPRMQLKIGVDFGLTPAAVIAQEYPAAGRVHVLRELVTDDMAAVEFGRQLRTMIQSEFGGAQHEGWGDPAGDQRSQVDARTPFNALHDEELGIYPCYTNDFQVRKTAVDDQMRTMSYDGKPALLVDASCSTLISGLAGRYAFKRVGSLTEERYKDVPDKTSHSHVCEALQYLLVGLGGGYSANAHTGHVPRAVRSMSRRVA